jgi:hypothetical protein
MAAAMPPEMGRVTSQASTMLRKIDQSTFSRDRNRPTNTTEPTLQCVVLIGRPILDATSTVSADPISMQKPLQQLQQHKLIVCVEWKQRLKESLGLTYAQPRPRTQQYRP